MCDYEERIVKTKHKKKNVSFEGNYEGRKDSPRGK